MSLKKFSAEGRLPANMRADDQFALYAIFRDIRNLFLETDAAIVASTPSATFTDPGVYQSICNTNGGLTNLGLAITETGTAGRIATDQTSWAGMRARRGYTTAAAARAGHGAGSPDAQAFGIGTSSDGGGFDIYIFGGSYATFGNSCSQIMGLMEGPGSHNSTSPSTNAFIGFVGMYCEAGGPWKFGTKASGSSSMTASASTGISIAANQLFSLRITNVRGSTDVTFSVNLHNNTTGAITSSSTATLTASGVTAPMEFCGVNLYSTPGGDQAQFVRGMAFIEEGVF